MSHKLEGSGVNYSIERLLVTTFRITLLTILVVGLTAGQLRAVSTWHWASDADNTWSTVSAWTENLGYPNVATDVANFNGLDIASDRTVTLDVAPTVGAMVFGDLNPTDTPAGWTITGSNTLTLDNGASPPATITVNALGNIANPKGVTISAPVTVTNGLTKSGDGALTLSNTVGLTAGDISAFSGLDDYFRRSYHYYGQH